MIGHPDTLAKQRLNEIAESLDVSPDWLIQQADNEQTGVGNGYISHPEDSERFEGQSLPDDFWDVYATYRNIPRDKVNDDLYLSCSC